MLDKNILKMRYADKPNLLTVKVYILSDSAAIGIDHYTQLISLSHTLGFFIRRVMKVLEFVMMKCKTIVERMNEMNIIMTKELLEEEAWRLILLSSQKHFPLKQLG